MRATQIDFKSFLPYAIQAYTEVFGEEYHSTISDKINSSIIIPYDDIQGLETYIEFRKEKKKEELIIKLLQEVGIISSEYNNFFSPLEDKIYDVIYTIFVDIDMCFKPDYDGELPLRAFKYDGYIEDKINLINFLRNFQKPKITKENWEEFLKTVEFNNLLQLINKMNEVYDLLLREYAEFEKQFESDINFIKNERKRKNEIFKKKKEEIWFLTFPMLPPQIKKVLKNKSPKEQMDIVLNHHELGRKFAIEYFSKENMDKLTSPNISKSEKVFIMRQQLKFLGSDINPRNFETNIDDYLQFLNRDDIKPFIPSEELINYIKKLRQRKNKEATKDFTIGREDVKNVQRVFGDNDPIIGSLVNGINSKLVCATYAYSKDSFYPILVYTIRNDEGGNLSFLLIHELGHIIEKNINNSGFDVTSNLNCDENKNPYDNAYRKYERFNETITDIFTIEVLKLLHKRNIFLIEPKEITDLSYNFGNTSFITQGLLKPLIEKFRKQVIKAKIFSQPQILTECIGKNNFEELVDVINKVDFLTINGLTEEKIEKEPQDPMVIEYNKQLERIKRIYQSIDEYYTNYCSSLEEKEQKQNS